MGLEIPWLTIEVGSTITKLNGFRLHQQGYFELVAQGFAPTTVLEGDVSLGVEAARRDLESRTGKNSVQPQIFVNSSAAGGLKMTVHGLTLNMTSRAAKEAALGAGALVKKITAGLLDESDLAEIVAIKPNIILLAGGVDFGEKNMILSNAKKLANLNLDAPVVYAGNTELQTEIIKIFTGCGIEILTCENVFPDVDVLNIAPLRKIIHEVFNRHIVHAPGMAYLEGLTNSPIMPTPGAVLLAAERFAEVLGDVVVIDVGGATTDVHSVTNGSLEWSMKLTDPEPYSKRTVEGDLGVYINAHNILEQQKKTLEISQISDLRAIPETEQQKEFTHRLCKYAVETAIHRHAGLVTDLYTPTGGKKIVKGKDLSAIKWLIGTGGALTRIEGGNAILKEVCSGAGKYLLPPPDSVILLDKNYLFSALGTLAQAYPVQVETTFKHWVEKDLN